MKVKSELESKPAVDWDEVQKGKVKTWLEKLNIREVAREDDFPLYRLKRCKGNVRIQITTYPSIIEKATMIREKVKNGMFKTNSDVDFLAHYIGVQILQEVFSEKFSICNRIIKLHDQFYKSFVENSYISEIKQSIRRYIRGVLEAGERVDEEELVNIVNRAVNGTCKHKYRKIAYDEIDKELGGNSYKRTKMKEYMKEYRKKKTQENHTVEDHDE